MKVSRRGLLATASGLTGTAALASVLSAEAWAGPLLMPAQARLAQPSSEQLTLEASNVQVVGATDLNGFGKMGEGIAIQQRPNGQRVAYLANESGPMGMSVVDVTDPANPGVLNQIPAEQGGAVGRFNSLSMSGNILTVAREVYQKGDKPAGIVIYDASDPTNLRQLSMFDTSGPNSRGVHYVWFVDGRYAHLTTGMPDFSPNAPSDDQIYVIVDLQDPENPREVGRWWLPGMAAGEKPFQSLAPQYATGFRQHNVEVLPSKPDRAYSGWIDGGAIILDISDLQHPHMIGRWDPHPPATGFTHTIVPQPARGIATASHEAISDNCSDYPRMIWVLDISDEANPISVSTMPMPDPADYCGRGGRFGAHNQHENHEQPTCMDLHNTVVGSFFNGGVRIYDTTNPYRPEELGYWVGSQPANSNVSAIQINDVFVDDMGFIYAVDRNGGGLYILQYTGEGGLR